MAQIYVSYPEGELEAVRPLLGALLVEGYSLTYDTGRCDAAQLQQDADEAACIVVVWSARAETSPRVHSEAALAIARRVLVPVSLDGTPVPAAFADQGVTDLSGWRGQFGHKGWAGVLAAVAGLVASPHHPGPAPTPRPAKRSAVPQPNLRPEPARPAYDGPPPERPDLVAVPGGTFRMGSEAEDPGTLWDELPRHKVTFAKGFAMGRKAVTFAEYDLFCAATGRNRPADNGWGRGAHPVIHVSWQDAADYCAWLSAVLGEPYRLPTEAEWEYCARAGTVTLYSTGDTISPSLANYDGHYAFNGSVKGLYRQRTVETGSLPPNPWGFHEMHGNVWEWCTDHHKDNYVNTPVDGAPYLIPEPKAPRIIRGGSWHTNPLCLRSAHRDSRIPLERSNEVGFRVVSSG